MADAELTPRDYARKLMTILNTDRSEHLINIDNYLHGHHEDPYLPPMASAEYRLLAQRCTINLMPLMVDTVTQNLYVDGVRPGRKVADREDLPEWEHYEVSRLASKQTALHKAALAYGHAFTITEKRGGVVQTSCLSPLRTSAVFADPANDETPRAIFTVVDWPEDDAPGFARMWDETDEYEVYFSNLADIDDVRVVEVGPHGASACPGTRFAASVDLDGRTVGVVEPLIVLQNRLNQTNLDLLAVQKGGAFKLRTVSGMEPPFKRQWNAMSGDWSYVLDDSGQPILDEMQLNPTSLLYSEDPNTKFGSIDETPLDGYLKAVEQGIRQFSALAQVPPHYLLGEIANLSAEALQAAELSLSRKVQMFQVVFGESWERVFRLAAELSGDKEAIDDYKVEVVWRDMEAHAISKVADAVGKLYDIGAPKMGLFRLLGLSENTLNEWEDLMEQEKEEDPTRALASSISRNRNARSTVVSGGSTQPVDEVP